MGSTFIFLFEVRSIPLGSSIMSKGGGAAVSIILRQIFLLRGFGVVKTSVLEGWPFSMTKKSASGFPSAPWPSSRKAKLLACTDQSMVFGSAACHLMG